VIRHAQARDAAAVAGLHAESWRRHYRGAYADSYLDSEVGTDRLAVWTDRLAGPNTRTVTLLADDGGVVVGFAHAIFDEHPRWGSLLENLHVAHDRHRQGIGSRLLLAAAHAVAERSTRQALYVWVLQQNVGAQSFYTALGGTRVEEGPCPAPGGVAARLHGTPQRLSFVWTVTLAR
jgi:GNAT superfamily N-acetyltransferase